jgi:hypothetical protein
MSLNVSIPDSVVDKCKKVISTEKDLESFVINAVSHYIDEIESVKNDSLLDFLTDSKNHGVDKDGIKDISINHDKYL